MGLHVLGWPCSTTGWLYTYHALPCYHSTPWPADTARHHHHAKYSTVCVPRTVYGPKHQTSRRGRRKEEDVDSFSKKKSTAQGNNLPNKSASAHEPVMQQAVPYTNCDEQAVPYTT